MERYVIPMGNVRGMMERSLFPYTGSATAYLNLEHVLYEIVEAVLFGKVFSCPSVPAKKLSRDYGVPIEVSEELVELSMDAIKRTVFTFFGIDSLVDVSWSFDLLAGGDIRLEIYGPLIKATRPWERMMEKVMEGNDEVCRPCLI